MKQGSSFDFKTHTPVKIFYTKVNIKKEIQSKIKGEKGFTAVSSKLDKI
jgi:hypothetical protein